MKVKDYELFDFGFKCPYILETIVGSHNCKTCNYCKLINQIEHKIKCNYKVYSINTALEIPEEPIEEWPQIEIEVEGLDHNYMLVNENYPMIIDYCGKQIILDCGVIEIMTKEK